MSHLVKKLLECHSIMTIPSSLLPNGYIRLTFFYFSEWNGRLEIKDLRGEMRRDFQNIKALIVSGNPSEKEDE